MLDGVRALPLASLEAFTADAQTTAVAESYLRRSLEALLDLGRHMLAKGFGEPAAKYKAIAAGLERHGVLDVPTARLLRTLAGYRNRMVHFYHELSAEDPHPSPPHAFSTDALRRCGHRTISRSAHGVGSQRTNRTFQRPARSVTTTRARGRREIRARSTARESTNSASRGRRKIAPP